MRLFVFLRACLLVAVALLTLTTPALANTQDGILITNSNTGRSIWVPEAGWIPSQGLLNTVEEWISRGDPNGYAAAIENLGCGIIYNRCSIEDMNNREAKDAGADLFFDEATGELVENYNERGSWALIIFDYAAGKAGSSCITCDFIAYFMAGITDFSVAIYAFFADGFIFLIPIMLAIWIGYRVAKLVTFGGEDGKAFIYSVVQKCALFVVIFLIFSQTVTPSAENGSSAPTEHYAWNMMGPNYLDYAFRLSGEIRNRSIAPISTTVGATADAQGNISPFGCSSVTPAYSSSGTQSMFDRYQYIQSGVEITCVTERTHIVGISTGLAVIFTSFNFTNFEASLTGFAIAYITALYKVMTGVMIMAIYILSAVWLIFLILDVVVRVMITAAFAPLLGGLFMWQPTRGMAVNALKAFFGSIMTAIALSIVSVLALYLMSNTVTVYNAINDVVAQNYTQSYQEHITDISENGLDGMRVFISRTQETSPDEDRIPMDWSTPWLYYICMAGLAVFALGKKITTMLESILDYEGISAFADNATKNFKGGVMGGALVAGGTLLATKAVAGMSVGPIGVGWGAGKTALNGGFRAGMGVVGSAIQNKFQKNPFANPERGVMDNVLLKGAKMRMQTGVATSALERADEQE